MPIAVDTSEAPEFLRITLHGNWPTIDEQREVRQRLIASGQLTESTRALIDFRLLASTVAYTEVAKIVAAAIQDGGLPFHRAYLVGSAVQYGLVRQMKSIAPPHIALEIFTDEQEALMWLWRSKKD